MRVYRKLSKIDRQKGERWTEEIVGGSYHQYQISICNEKRIKTWTKSIPHTTAQPRCRQGTGVARINASVNAVGSQPIDLVSKGVSVVGPLPPLSSKARFCTVNCVLRLSEPCCRW